MNVDLLDKSLKLKKFLEANPDIYIQNIYSSNLGCSESSIQNWKKFSMNINFKIICWYHEDYSRKYWELNSLLIDFMESGGAKYQITSNNGCMYYSMFNYVYDSQNSNCEKFVNSLKGFLKKQ